MQAVVDADLTSLRAFMELVNYYGKFLPELASVSAPLYQLMKKNQDWNWSASQENAWKKNKLMLSSSEVLCHYNPNLPVRLACDASAFGVAAVLSHILPSGAERPVAYASN